MAVNTLKTRIKLLYKTWSEWQEIQDTFFPLAGEVCIVEIPQGTSGFVNPPAVMIKIGQWDGVDGSVSKKAFSQLPYIQALSADNYAWSKKENLDWADMTESFKQGIIELVGGDEQNTVYRIVGDGENKWKLQSKDIKDPATSWTDVTGSIIDLSNTISTINANIAKKVDKEITGTNGKAMIFNEADGGGAKFIHTDGTESFVGVNDGGEDGLMAQIYADKLVDGKWQGAKIDVTNGGIYYTVGNKPFAQRAVADNEIVVKKDIKDIEGGMHFIGAIVPEAGESLEQTIARLYATKGKSYADRKPGDIVIIRTPGDDREYICDSDKQWVELGSQGLYATKAELAAEEEARTDADTALEAAITAEATRAQTAEATKVDKEITSAEGKSMIFNEADGGGAKFENTNGINSFVGVNNGASDEDVKIAAQIYAVDTTTSGHNLGAKLDVTVDGMYYTTGAASGASPSTRQQTKNEIAVKGDITEAASTLDTKIDAEIARATAAESSLSTGKLDVMPGDEYTAGNPYNLPYYFETTADGNKVTVTAKTVTLDGQKTHGQYSMDVTAATQSTAGLMNATDKAKLDHFYAKDLTQEEGDILILNCNI